MVFRGSLYGHKVAGLIGMRGLHGSEQLTPFANDFIVVIRPFELWYLSEGGGVKILQVEGNYMGVYSVLNPQYSPRFALPQGLCTC